jgi:hypothetical protein
MFPRRRLLRSKRVPRPRKPRAQSHLLSGQKNENASTAHDRSEQCDNATADNVGGNPRTSMIFFADEQIIQSPRAMQRASPGFFWNL